MGGVITKEAIEALQPFADAVFNDNGDMTVDRAFAKSEDFIKAYFVHKRLSTLPIAVEGKEWRPIASAPQSGKIVMLAWSPDDWTTGQGFYRDGKWVAVGTFYNHAAGNPPYEFRQINVAPVLWTDIGSPSSPGKDGGQEVEAVGEAGEMPGSNGGFTMAAFKASEVPLGTKLYTRPQPASTALVERLTKALEPFAALASVIDDLRHEDNSTCPHRLRAADIREARSALSSSTSRENAE